MYLVYADESGDPGLGGGTPFYVVSGIIIHETQWNGLFQRIIELRRGFAQRYSLPHRIAFHAYDMANGHGEFHHSQCGLKGRQRMAVYRETLEFLAQQAGVRVLNVFARKLAIKRTDVDVFDRSWEYFIQRTHNFAQSGGTIGDADDHCLLITDRTQDDRLRYLMRRMRAYNYVPSSLPGESPRKILATRVLDDPVPRVSLHSYLVQLADLVGYALARRDFPRNTLKRYAFEGFFDLLSPVLLKEASKRDPQGIVYWPRQDAVK